MGPKCSSVQGKKWDVACPFGSGVESFVYLLCVYGSVLSDFIISFVANMGAETEMDQAQLNVWMMTATACFVSNWSALSVWAFCVLCLLVLFLLSLHCQCFCFCFLCTASHQPPLLMLLCHSSLVAKAENVFLSFLVTGFSLAWIQMSFGYE